MATKKVPVARSALQARIPRQSRVKPTSVRLTAGELDELRGLAGGMDVSISEAARRAILAYLGRRAVDVDRRTAGDLVTLFGQLHSVLRGAQNPDVMIEPLKQLEAACQAVVARYARDLT